MDRDVASPASDSDSPGQGRRPAVLLSVGLAVGWRVAAYLRPSSLIGIPAGLLLPLGLLGLFFLASGTLVYFGKPGRAARIFFLYGLGQSVHWGGSVGSASHVLEMGLFFVYLAFTALGEAALLHLALFYPGTGTVGRPARVLLYAPAALALLMAPIAGSLPQAGAEAGGGLLLLVSTLYGLAAGVILIVRFARADAETRRGAGLGIIVLGLAAGSLVSLLGNAGVLPGPGDAYNLALAAVPAAFAAALLRRPSV